MLFNGIHHPVEYGATINPYRGEWKVFNAKNIGLAAFCYPPNLINMKTYFNSS